MKILSNGKEIELLVKKIEESIGKTIVYIVDVQTVGFESDSDLNRFNKERNMMICELENREVRFTKHEHNGIPIYRLKVVA